MTNLIYIAAGGAIGAVLRYSFSSVATNLLGRGFPFGTLSVNILGAFLIGYLSIAFAQRFELNPELRLALIVGLLGSFTTFSTFSMETLELLYSSDYVKACVNIVSSVFFCLLAAYLGLMLAKQL